MATILIVDDSPQWREIARLAALAGGHTIVAEAADGLEALAAYQAHHPDLVTLDVQMPHMDGVTCLESLRTIDPAARVVMVTGVGSLAVRTRCTALGAAGFVTKPYQADELTDALTEALLG